MTARTYTPEAIAALVKAAERVAPYEDDIRDALRPFTTEPSSWAAFCRELWGEGWSNPLSDNWRRVTAQEKDEARTAYRARYGVEP